MERVGRELDADRLVFVRAFELLEPLLRTDQRNATARDHALFNGGTRRVQDAKTLIDIPQGKDPRSAESDPKASARR